MANLTIKDIARISGCSVSTISRVINDRPDVRPETKEHVLKVMREAGFVPNTNARQLKIQQSRSLVFVVKGTRNIFFSDFLVQLQRAATLYGYNGIVSYLDENANEIDAAEKILREIKPKGIIFLGGSVANFQRGFDRINVPSVLTTLVTDELDFPNLSMVGVDDRAAAYTAVDYLIRQGHRKIAVLGGPVTSYPSLMRRQGAQQAMEDAGIVFNDKLYGLSNYDFESAYHAMNSLLARRAEFTALFAMSDVIGDDHHRPAQRADRTAKHRTVGAADRAWLLCPDRDPAAGVAAGRKRKGNLNFVFPPSKDGEYIVDL